MNLRTDCNSVFISGHSPTVSMSFEFPDLTQIPDYGGRPFSRQSDDSTPQATPRATPRPNLRDSIRAASRQSLMKLSTPGLKQLDKSVDKSASMTSSRSTRSSKCERSERVLRRKQNSESNKDISIDEEKTLANNDNLVIEVHAHQTQSLREIPVIITQNPTPDMSGGELKIIESNNSETVCVDKISENVRTSVSKEVEEINNHASVFVENQHETVSNDNRMEHTDNHSKDSNIQDSIILSQDEDSAVHSAQCSFERLESTSESIESEPTLNPDTNLEPKISPEPDQETSFCGQDFDPYLPRGTPVSYSSGISCSSHSVLFMGTSEHFYYVCPQVGGEMETTLKNYEQCQLVEECYQKKISPEYILRIISSRRRNDVNARNFIRNLPYDLIQRLTVEEDDVSMCVSS